MFGAVSKQWLGMCLLARNLFPYSFYGDHTRTISTVLFAGARFHTLYSGENLFLAPASGIDLSYLQDPIHEQRFQELSTRPGATSDVLRFGET